MILEESNDFRSTFSARVIEGGVVPAVLVDEVRTVVNKVLDGLQVSFRSSDSKSCATIVVVRVDLPAEDVESLHVVDVVVESGVKKSELIFKYARLVHQLAGGCSFSPFCTVLNQKL